MITKTETSPEETTDIRENAELFKELLAELSKEDIKKARIQDIGDYVIKILLAHKKKVPHWIS